MYRAEAIGKFAAAALVFIGLSIDEDLSTEGLLLGAPAQSRIHRNPCGTLHRPNQTARGMVWSGRHPFLHPSPFPRRIMMLDLSCPETHISTTIAVAA